MHLSTSLQNDLFSAAPTTVPVSLSAGDDNPFFLAEADTDALTMTEVVDLVIYYYQTDFYTRHTRSPSDPHVARFKNVLMPGGFLVPSVEDCLSKHCFRAFSFIC